MRKVASHLLDANGQLIVRERRDRAARPPQSVLQESPTAREPTGETPPGKRGRAQRPAASPRALNFGDRDFAPDGDVDEAVPVVPRVGPRGRGQPQEARNAPTAAPNQPGDITGAENVVAEAAERHLLVQYHQQVNAGRCSCGLLGKSVTALLAKFCRQQDRDPFWRGENNELTRRQMPKARLLLTLCVVCKTVAEVEAAKVAGGFVHGIPPKFWNPPISQPGQYSVLDGFYYVIGQLDLAALGVNAAELPNALSDLNAFRAHLGKHFVTNFKFYVLKGKVNKFQNVGQNQVVLSIDRCSNFSFAMSAAFDHYQGIHSVNTCGRLRKGLNCNPFKLIQTCHQVVQRALRDAVTRVCSFVLTQNATISSLESSFSDQEALVAHFGIQ